MIKNGMKNIIVTSQDINKLNVLRSVCKLYGYKPKRGYILYNPAGMTKKYYNMMSMSLAWFTRLITQPDGYE